MSVPAEYARELAAFPAVLRELVEAELSAGNAIVEIASGFPAPPVGACLKLARNVSTRPRQSAGGLDFYERNTSSYLSEITDAKRHYFVLEPPAPPEPEPDMDAIRAARSVPSSLPPAAPVAAPDAVTRFKESMTMDYERWHDGTGYDVATLSSCTPDELTKLENILTSVPPRDWRGVEALAALGTPAAHARLREAMLSGSHELAMAVLRHAPEILSAAERATALVAALDSSSIYGGLTQALDLVEEFHPPEVMAALWRGALERDGETAVHFAAILMFLHGKAASAFDWNLRPFYLRFNTGDRAEREQVFRELCRQTGQPAAPYLNE